MTTTLHDAPTDRPRTSRRRGYLRFAGHYLEMLVAMLVGMVALGPLWSWATPGLTDRADAQAMIMAADMTIGMGLWMKIRRHSWRHIVEMSAAMILPFVALLLPYRLGVISGGTLMTGGHLLMLPAMLVAMLLRRADHRHH
ncbi:hypothetical protein [Micromonospora mirobrigensis]|uniref:Flagellar biosynthetic protein FliP n=1 Tax=Micromonospora mirobrigensis TaxID=262898 RepID=A0A1C4UX57_9ACTN|nr:hypothetical protein [Micromonospora mirobrigensis]SCE76251.1 hypothetical protein GA0070564_101781 [Micromonospora mirobrigensis]